MNLMLLAAAALATWQAVEIWHHSTLFATRRAMFEARSGFVSDLARCPWCLSVWVGTLFVFIVWIDANVPALFVYGLAVSRLANLGNDLCHGVCRTPRYPSEE